MILADVGENPNVITEKYFMRDATRYFAATLFGLALAVPAAHANLILDSSGVVAPAPNGLPLSTPAGAGNDWLFTPATLFFGQLRTDAPGSIVFEYVGTEAGYTNEFDVGGATIFTTSGGTDLAGSATGSLAASASFVVGTGLVDFAFCAPGGDLAGAYGRCVENDSAASILGQYNHPAVGSGYRGVAFWQQAPNKWVAFFDDSGGNDDDDFDDMIVRIAYAPERVALQNFNVPEPGTLALLSLGVAGLVWRRRKQ